MIKAIRHFVRQPALADYVGEETVPGPQVATDAEIMTAAALFVVLAAAAAMVSVGLSMAMGAFLAGVLLSESTFKHQLEADVEPFRGILLGLFFLGVGM